MKKYLFIAILLVIGVFVWLWSAEEPAPVAPPAPVQAPPKPAAQETPPQPAVEDKKTMRVAFINHLGDAHIKFTVDGVEVCTANAGQSCYGDIPFGKHTVTALEGKQVVRTLELTLDKSHPDPKVVVCFPTSPDC